MPPRREDLRVTFTIPQALVPALREFARANEFRTDREAVSALIEGGMIQYPRWGVKRGVVNRVRSEASKWLVEEVRTALRDIERRFLEMMAAPLDEDMVEPEPEEPPP